MDQDQLLAYLQLNEKKLNMQALADEANVPVRTVRSYARGERGLKRAIPAETVTALAAALESLKH